MHCQKERTEILAGERKQCTKKFELNVIHLIPEVPQCNSYTQKTRKVVAVEYIPK